MFDYFSLAVMNPLFLIFDMKEEGYKGSEFDIFKSRDQLLDGGQP